ncbi:hypothetical protein CF386_09805 [Paraphotobacterium marinum]|uniref:HTH lysR-type domain-containing protein n=1 Tax=Paraphotobacterium marinum TaxID=1755811 RepID=A0A220VG59_9GAMM|nr:LysR family transcriptional regulator [Paraphotobacterium marinum]ASK79347.1 hypothetical protein CF386_09805 [Paraphotobacterium marinum]
MSDFDRFETFIYVAENESITVASQKLGITKASVSKQISKIEDEYNIKLFQRVKQRIQLSKEGKILLEKCINLRNEFEYTKSLLRGVHTKPEGNLNIVVEPGIAKTFIYPFLINFFKKYPHINLIFKTYKSNVNYALESVDVFLGFSNIQLFNHQSFINKQLFSIDFTFCASKQYIENKGNPVKKSDFDGHCLIDCTDYKNLNCNLDLFKKSQTILSVDSFSELIDCALNHLGIILVPKIYIKEYLDNKILKNILCPVELPNQYIMSSYLPEKIMSSKVKCFLDFLSESKNLILNLENRHY